MPVNVANNKHLNDNENDNEKKNENIKFINVGDNDEPRWVELREFARVMRFYLNKNGN